MNIHQKLAIKALEQMKGDDLIHAQKAFANMTPAEMQIKFGQSGETRAQVLARYEAYVATLDAAIAWIEAQPSGRS